MIEPVPLRQEEPMLDVHLIHAPVRAWRDFFIHVAIIVVGLCIAVGIQQTVEFVHHHYQLAELRQALRLEREENYKSFVKNATAWRRNTAELQNNLLVLQFLREHPGTAQEKLPGILTWESSSHPFASAVWDAAHQSGVTALLPQEEIERYNDSYMFLRMLTELQNDALHAIEKAERYDFLDVDPSHLAPTQITTEIELTEDALTAQYLRGNLLLNLVQAFPDFPATVTPEELSQVRRRQDPPTSELLGAARAMTMQRLKAAGSDPKPSPGKK
jgi:hypothetical protein